jgi:hypothetical protein
MTAKRKTATKKTQPPRVDTEWFLKRMADSEISLRGLAKLMKLDPSSLHHALNGRRRFQISEVANLAKILHTTAAEVARRAGVPIGNSAAENRVPLVGWVDLEHDSDIDLKSTGEMIDAPPGLISGAVAVQIRAPNSPADGEIIFIEQPRGGVPADCMGRKCLARMADGSHAIRYVRRGYKAGAVNLLCDGGPAITDAKPEWVAPILWVKSA